MLISIPYGQSHLSCEVPDGTTVLAPKAPQAALRTQDSLLDDAMRAPIGSLPLHELAKGKKKITVIASDHTRPVPSKLLMPRILSELRQGNPEAEITILIATGCHRGTTKEELVAKFGEEIVAQETIVIHDCEDKASLVTIGTLPSGGELSIHRLAAEADLLVSEGFIEPHFFAGFSGGRKSVLPGVASRVCVHYNHNADFIDHPNARMGVLSGNPIHEDMIYAARTAKLAFIVNAVLNAKGETVAVFAGDCDAAHRQGCAFVDAMMRKTPAPADIVITSNNGYPLDQNLYQMVKGMTTAQATCKKGGVIIAVGECSDGIGGDSFARMLSSAPDMATLLAQIRATPKDETVTDQWQVQILARILTEQSVILISSLPEASVRPLGFIPAASLAEALALAREKFDHEPSLTVIPEGISVIL